MKPEWHLFKTESGEWFEDQRTGRKRDCFPIRIEGQVARSRLITELRREYGFEVAVGRNVELSRDYLVSGRLDGEFTSAQVEQLQAAYKALIISPEAPALLPREARADDQTVIRGPWKPR